MGQLIWISICKYVFLNLRLSLFKVTFIYGWLISTETCTTIFVFQTISNMFFGSSKEPSINDVTQIYWPPPSSVTLDLPFYLRLLSKSDYPFPLIQGWFPKG